MSASTFLTQKQLMTKNMPAGAMDNPFAQQQKILLYVFPLIFAVSGVNFPIGVLLYWLTTNLWSMGQQFYVIRRMPAPGSAAEEALAPTPGREEEARATRRDRSDRPAPPGPRRAPSSGGSPSPNGAGPPAAARSGEAATAATPADLAAASAAASGSRSRQSASSPARRSPARRS